MTTIREVNRLADEKQAEIRARHGVSDGKMWCEVEDAEEYREYGQRFPMLRATVDGQTYMIPEAWVIGFLNRNFRDAPGADVADAARYWHAQALLADRAK